MEDYEGVYVCECAYVRWWKKERERARVW